MSLATNTSLRSLQEDTHFLCNSNNFNNQFISNNLFSNLVHSNRSSNRISGQPSCPRPATGGDGLPLRAVHTSTQRQRWERGGSLEFSSQYRLQWQQPSLLVISSHESSVYSKCCTTQASQRRSRFVWKPLGTQLINCRSYLIVFVFFS